MSCPSYALPNADALAQVAPGHFQRIGVSVEGEDDSFDIINVPTVVDALDEARSGVTYWPQSGGLSDEVGKLLLVSDLHVNPDAAASAQLFRLSRWMPPVIVSEAVRDVLASATGAVIMEV